MNKDKHKIFDAQWKAIIENENSEGCCKNCLFTKHLAIKVSISIQNASLIGVNKVHT